MGWIGVDLDGTMAEYHGFKSPGHIGAPIPAMVNRVKRWLQEGRDVRVFTARVSHPQEKEAAKAAIIPWCIEHIGQELQITCVKDLEMDELYDDRAVQVERNTGRIMGASTRGLGE